MKRASILKLLSFSNEALNLKTLQTFREEKMKISKNKQHCLMLYGVVITILLDTNLVAIIVQLEKQLNSRFEILVTSTNFKRITM